MLKVSYCIHLDTKYDIKLRLNCHNDIVYMILPFILGCSMYVALFPCNECTKMILQSGIKEIVYFRYYYRNITIKISYDKYSQTWMININYYICSCVSFSDKHSENPSMIASRRMLSMAGVSVRQFVPIGKLTIDFDVINRS